MSIFFSLSLPHTLTLLLSIAVRSYDDKTLKEFSTPNTMRRPWKVQIYMFNYHRGIGVVISNKHVLIAASSLYPYRGTPNINYISSLSPNLDDSLVPNFW